MAEQGEHFPELNVDCSDFLQATKYVHFSIISQLRIFIDEIHYFLTRSITAVLPLIPYSKGHMSYCPDDCHAPVYLRTIAKMFKVSGVGRIMTLDMHSNLVRLENRLKRNVLDMFLLI